ncbi:hypothetical protein DsansV1_C24g0180461 [Dioscorea sansibarensis]
MASQVDGEDGETNLDHSLPSELSSSIRSANELCSSLAPPCKRHKEDGFVDKLNVRGKANGVKSGERIEVEIYDGRIKWIILDQLQHPRVQR